MRKSFCVLILLTTIIMSCLFAPISSASVISVDIDGETKIDAWSFSESYDYSTGGELQKASNAGGKLIGVNYNDKISFSLNIAIEGIYAVKMAIATPENSKTLQKFDLSVDEKVVHKTELSGGKGMTVPVENFVGVISLDKGERKLTFTATSASMYLFYIKLERLTSTDIGDVRLVKNQGLRGEKGFLTFAENSVSVFEAEGIEAGFYKISLLARAEENSSINLSLSDVTKGIINIFGDDFYETALYCYLKSGDNLFKFTGLKGNVDFSYITLHKLSDDAEEILKTFSETVNNAENEENVKEAINEAKTVLHPKGDYPEEKIVFSEPVYLSLLNKGYMDYNEAIQAYFTRVGTEINNPSVKMLCNDEIIREIKGGNISVELNKNEFNTKTAFAAIYENNRLKYIASFLSENGTNPKAELGNVILKDDAEYQTKVFFLDNLESISPYDAKIFKELYVDCRGNDETGNGSINAPFKTIKRAKEEVAEISDVMTGDIIVNIASGKYFLDETEIFDGTSGGKNGFNVIYKGESDSKPQIIGGKRVTDWSYYKDGIYSVPLDRETELRNLYVNGYAAIRARGEILYEAREYFNSPDNQEEKDGFVIYPYLFPEVISRPEDLELVFNMWWVNQRLSVENIIRNDDEIIFVTNPVYYTEDNNSKLSVGAGQSFYIENALELLNEPGEFYFSKSEKKLYYYPKSENEILKGEIYVPETEFLIDIKGTENEPVQNLQFINLDVRYGEWNEVSEKGILFRQADETRTGMGLPLQIPGQFKVNYAENILIENCEFSCLASAAIAMSDGVHNVRINGNIIRDISGSGIIIGTSEHTTAETDKKRCKNISITNNVITRVAQEYMGNVAISAYYEKGVEITNNVIKETPYSGIHIGWGWLSSKNYDFGYFNISNNHIEDVMCVMMDGAHIYTLGPITDGVISGNYLKTSGDDYGGIYNDSGSEKISIFENVIEDVSHSWTMWDTGADIKTYSNYATVDKCRISGGAVAEGIGDITLFEADNKPKEVTDIIQKAGLRDKYKHLLQKASLPDGEKSLIKNVPSQVPVWEEYYLPVSGKKEAVIEGQYFIDTYHTDRYDGVIHNSGTIYLSYNSGEWVTYRINVLEEGTYSFSTLYSYGGDASNLPCLGVSVDKELRLSGCCVPATEKWHSWDTGILGNLTLSEGNHEITVRVEKSGLHMQKFMLNKIN